MKSMIEYYYSLKVDNLRLDNEIYNFKIRNEYYYFVPYFRTEKDLDDIINIINELKKRNIDVHELILNIHNSFLTKIDEVNYILLKVKNKDEKYEIFDMISFNKKLKLSSTKTNLYHNNWANLWSTKIDYIEKQISEVKIPNIIKMTIDYYIGLTENAIYYVNNTNLRLKLSNNDNIVLSHKRVYYPNYKLNYLNPLSFIFDLEVRDIAEYIKSVFFNNEDAYIELSSYLKSHKLTEYSYNMLFARLLYPSYYFDLYETIVNKNSNSDELIKIIHKTKDYELFLKKAYHDISKYALLDKIDWLIY